MHAFHPFDYPICFAYPLRLPNHIAVPNWIEHTPFAMFLVDISRPSSVVELGTHTGVSYCSFCQAVKELGLNTSCYALDTWQGDAQSEFYGPEVLADLRAHHDALYGDFSRLIQGTFDDGLFHFADGTIDLLHIDGCHTYEAVKHDYEQWLPKMSNRGIILFHDSNVRERTFGVWKLWEELKQQHPGKHFEFLHGNGLGVLVVGQVQSDPLQGLLMAEGNELAHIRTFFYQLGQRLTIRFERDQATSQIAEHGRVVQTLTAQARGKTAQLTILEARIAGLEASREQAADHITRLVQESASWQDRALAVESTLSAMNTSRGMKILTSWWHLRLRAAERVHVNHQTIGRGHYLLRRSALILQTEGPHAFANRVKTWIRRQRRDYGTSMPQVAPLDLLSRYYRWLAKYEPDAAALEQQLGDARQLAYRPLISVIIPVYDPPLSVLCEAITSVLNQTYEHWELCLANGGHSTGCKALLDAFAARDQRIKLVHLLGNEGISGNSNAALALATGEFIALLDHDDLLAPFALYTVAKALNAHEDLDILYSDEDKITAEGKRLSPFMKPDWSPELLHSFMYVGHLTVYRHSLVEQLGGFRKEYDGSQDYDLVFRATEKTERIHHIPQVLYHWRMSPNSIAAESGAKSYARYTHVAALADAMVRRGHEGQCTPYTFPNRFRFALREKPMVSIVIPTDDLGHVTACLRGLYGRTQYSSFEVLVVTNRTVATAIEQESSFPGLGCVLFDEAFNFSRKCNIGAQHARGSCLIFLNDDVTPLTEDWIEVLLEYAQQPEIGGVSPKLLYPNDTIQYAGLVTGVRDLVGTAFHGYDRYETTYHDMALAVRNVSTLTGACMMVRTEDFWGVGGWDEVNTPIANSDFDLSFRLRERGLRLVYTPFVELRHIGHQSIGKTDASHAGMPPYDGSHLFMLDRWGDYMSYDPYYPNNMRDLLHNDGDRYRVYAYTSHAVREWRTQRSILLISHDLSLSGAPIMLFELARFLRAAGYFVAVIAPEADKLLTQYAAERIPVIIDPDILKNPSQAAHLFGAFDLIVPSTILGWRCVHTAKSVDKPCVWLVHESEFGVHYLLSQGREAHSAFGAADVVIFPATLTIGLYERFTPHSPYLAVHYGIADVAAVAPLDSPYPERPGVIRLLHAGTIEPRKGSEILLRSLQRLPVDVAGRVEAYFIGRRLDPSFGFEPYVERVHALARSMDNAHFLGEVPRELVLGYMKHADVFICTSQEETGPVVVFEAMALGKAVISTSVGVASEVIESGINGVLIEVDDVDALAQCIVQIVRDPGQFVALGRAARDTYERHLTLERYGNDLLAVFAPMTEGKVVKPVG